MAEPSAFALLVLAAGASRRMGRPKQLLPVEGRPLLRQVVDAAVASSAAPVIVVLGAHADEIRPCLDGLSIHIAVNADWAEGMGSSVRAGMRALDSLAPDVSVVVLTLCDQPGFSARHVQRLLEAHQLTGRPIVASRCAGRRQPPVLFAAKHFEALCALGGDEGARAILQKHPDDISDVPADDLQDLDTLQDYADYLSKGEK